MKKNLSILPCLIWILGVNAQEPTNIESNFTMGPSPIVTDNMTFIVSYRETEPDRRDWILYSTTDNNNWREHGSAIDLSVFEWLTPAEEHMGAKSMQIVKKGELYYIYASISKDKIGVLESDDLRGPWFDPLGYPLKGPSYEGIDPNIEIGDDGLIKIADWRNMERPKPIATNFNPYVEKVEAETMSEFQGVRTKYLLNQYVDYGADGNILQICQNHDVVISDINDGDYILVKSVDLGAKGAKKIVGCIKCSGELAKKGSRKRRQTGIEVHLDAPNGKTVAVLQTPRPGKNATSSFGGRTKGVHDIYFVFRGEGYDFDWWRLVAR